MCENFIVPYFQISIINQDFKLKKNIQASSWYSNISSFGISVSNAQS